MIKIGVRLSSEKDCSVNNNECQEIFMEKMNCSRKRKTPREAGLRAGF
jgi:hypothetical protein